MFRFDRLTLNPQRIRICHPILEKRTYPLLATLPFLAVAGMSFIPNLSQPIPFGAPVFAQTVPQVPARQQGNQITLNGRTLPGVWSQQEGRIGLSDAALTQVMGVDLLNSSDAARQPVQWFSQPADAALQLSAWLGGPYRYLDVTPLQQRYGWRLQPQGNVLTVETSSAQVIAVRQGRQVWGDRIVIDLDRAAPWQIIEDRGTATITVHANLNPASLQTFRAGPGNLLTGLQVQAQGTQTAIQVQMPSGIRPYVWTLPNPNRLVIDIRPDSLPQREILWAPGVQWQQQFVAVGNARFPVVILKVDPRQSGVTLKPIQTNPNGAVGISPLVTIAQNGQAAGAINGGFFNRNNQLPLGVVRRDGRWLSGPILNRGAIAWNDQGAVEVGRLTLFEELTTAQGQRFPVLHLNSGYVEAGISRYTPDWGQTYTTLADNEVLVAVQQGRVVSQQTAGPSGTSASIPTDGYLLTVRANAAAAGALRPGTAVSLTPTTVPSNFAQYPHIVGAGPLLIQDRRIVLDAASERFSDAFIRQAASRSAIGVLPDGRLMFVAVHEGLGGRGPTLSEIAQLMQQLGAVHALNLDGGSSTSLYLGGRLLDRSSRTAARVHNGIGIFVEPRP